MGKFERVISFIDTANEKIGRVLCFVFIVLMIIQVMDVVLRYVFNNPTMWGWELNLHFFTGSVMIAGGYALLHDTHVKLDILHRNWSDRKKTIVDLITYPLVFLALCVVIWKGAEGVLWAWKIDQHSHSWWGPVLWPVKSCLPIAALMVLMQGIAKYGRLINSIRNPLDEGQEASQ